MSYSGFRHVYMRQPNKTLKEMEYDSFIAVFVDASRRQFQHRYRKGGVHSGMDASLDLRAEIGRYLGSARLHNPKTFLLVYVHGNLREIDESFHGENPQEQWATFREFKQGFCMRLPGCEIIIADLDSRTTSGRKCVESLIRLTVTDTRNAMVLLAGMPYEDCIRIRCDSTLDGNHQKKLRVAWLFDIFEEVGFRSQARSVSDATPIDIGKPPPLQLKRNSLPDPDPERLAEYRAAIRRPSVNITAAGSVETPLGPAKTKDPTVIETLRANRKANGKISTLRQATQVLPRGPKAIAGSRVSKAQVSSTQPPVQAVLRDQQGRRLDPVLRPRQDLLGHVEHWRLCNKYHLLSAGCSFPNCKHLHMVEDVQSSMLRDLTAEEQTALRMMARRSPCRNGTSCNDVECFAGHRCPNHVVKGQRKCSFPEVMHFAITET